MRLSDLYSSLSRKNLHFPFLFEDSPGTVGGMVATGRLTTDSRCFNISRWVLALRVILANGEIVKTGAVTYKCVAGYDLPKLFCGSFGTLGVISSASLRIYPAESSPFGRDLLPVQPKFPILTDIERVPVLLNRANEIALRIKRTLDPEGIFPAISGWNGYQLP